MNLKLDLGLRFWWGGTFRFGGRPGPDLSDARPEARDGQPLARVPNLARERFYLACERDLGNQILPPSNEKVSNLQAAVLSDETRCPFLHFRVITIRYSI